MCREFGFRRAFVMRTPTRTCIILLLCSFFSIVFVGLLCLFSSIVFDCRCGRCWLISREISFVPSKHSPSPFICFNLRRHFVHAQIDAAPFRDFIDSRYGLSLGKKKAAAAKAGEEKKEEVKHNKNYAKVQAARLKARLVGLKDKKDHIDEALKERFNSGRLLACISSRPGQSGRADGYILEGKELDFYVKKLKTKK